MRASIAYLTSTAATAAPLPVTGGAHHLEVLGWHRGERAVYLREHLGNASSLLHVVRTRGEHAGRMIPVAADDPRAAEVTPMVRISDEWWSLTTRVVQRRALRLPDSDRPIRKFAVQLTVELVVGTAPPSRTVVTSYLRPRAQLDGIWAIPGESLALARVAYVGVPEGVGLDKHVAMLVGRDLH
jgi:hypothetical protein